MGFIDLISFINRQRTWSIYTFGRAERYLGVVNHIRKELLEIEQNPTDLVEWIDVIILALDGAWRTGHTSEQIVQALMEKQAINFKRVWPTHINPSQPSEHIEEHENGHTEDIE